MTKDAYYFSHDSNARHDPKIVKLLSKYPMGYQWFFMIIEILREQKDYKYPIDDYTWNAIAYELHTDCILIEPFVNDCINTFALLSSDSEFFWSESLQKRMFILDEKKEILRANANERWRKHKENANAMQLHSKSNASKVKKSKVKESKVKEEVMPEPQKIEVSDYSFLLNDNSLFFIPLEILNQYQNLYPNVNLDIELKKITAWCLSNPKKRKTKSGALSFVNTWLSKSQDTNIGNQNGNSNPTQRNFADIINDIQQLETPFIK